MAFMHLLQNARITPSSVRQIKQYYSKNVLFLVVKIGWRACLVTHTGAFRRLKNSRNTRGMIGHQVSRLVHEQWTHYNDLHRRQHRHQWPSSTYGLPRRMAAPQIHLVASTDRSKTQKGKKRDVSSTYFL